MSVVSKTGFTSVGAGDITIGLSSDIATCSVSLIGGLRISNFGSSVLDDLVASSDKICKSAADVLMSGLDVSLLSLVFGGGRASLLGGKTVFVRYD